MISLNHEGFLVSHFFLYIYHKIDFLSKKIQVYFFISQNRFCDIKNRFGYIKFEFLISQSGGFIVHTGLFQDFINNNLYLSKNLRPTYIYIYL